MNNYSYEHTKMHNQINIDAYFTVIPFHDESVKVERIIGFTREKFYSKSAWQAKWWYTIIVQ